MRKEQFSKANISFYVGKKYVDFSIVHNLPEKIFGSGIQEAFDAWIARTSVFTAQSFIDYINSKTHLTGNKAMTVEQFKYLTK